MTCDRSKINPQKTETCVIIKVGGLCKMTNKKIKRFDMRLSDDTLQKLKMLAFSESCTMSEFVERLILTAWDDQIKIDSFVAYMNIVP